MSETTSPPGTLFPTITTMRPSQVPSGRPTTTPTNSNIPSRIPTVFPSVHPTTSEEPSQAPSESAIPSESPSQSPTERPSDSPSEPPTDLPSAIPTKSPTVSPVPSQLPSIPPTLSQQPSDRPSFVPSESQQPSISPSQQPSVSTRPSSLPSISNQPSVSDQPSSTPSKTPSDTPSVSIAPSMYPSISHQPSVSAAPSQLPSVPPSDYPSTLPTVSPYPSVTPSEPPTKIPSASPSREPSSTPSMEPTYTPNWEVRDVGMYITGLDDRFGKGTIGRQFESLINRHTVFYWDTVLNGGTVVYSATTEFQAIRRPPRGWRPPARTTGDVVPLGARVRQQVRQDGIDVFADDEADTVDETTTTTSPSLDASTNTPTEVPTMLNGTRVTLAPTFDIGLENWTLNNGTFVNETDHNKTFAPSSMPSTSVAPSYIPSELPSASPSLSQMPSSVPTETYQPSNPPSPLPESITWVIWYTQNVTYGEVYTNDSRANDIWEIFSFPFLLDQKRFTNEFINITNNQLPMFVTEMEIRDGSAAPSIAPSGVPTELPSQAPSNGPPTRSPTPPASTGIGTTGIIIAVVVPVMVVLLIAFAGIIYVTRVDRGEEYEPSASYLDDIPIPMDAQSIGRSGHSGPGSRRTPPPPPPGDFSVGPGSIAPSVMTRQTSYGTPAAAEPLIDTTEILQAAQQQQLQQRETPRAGEHSTRTPPRVSSHPNLMSMSVVSEMTTDDRSTFRRPSGGRITPLGRPTPRGTPGFMSSTGTFTPAQSGVLSSQASEITPRSGIARSNLTRANTTGGIGDTGRGSPFRGGGIPTIPTAQLSVPEVASVAMDDSEIHDGISESSETDEEDVPSMSAFNLQISEIPDDF